MLPIKFIGKIIERTVSSITVPKAFVDSKELEVGQSYLVTIEKKIEEDSKKGDNEQ